MLPNSTPASSSSGALQAAPPSAVQTEAGIPPKRKYNLPRGDAATMLQQFAGISGKPVLFMMDKVQGEQTNAIHGEYSPDEALALMLAGTSLEITPGDPAEGFVIARRSMANVRAEVGRDQKSQPETMRPQTLSAKIHAWLAHGALAVASIASAQETADTSKEAPKKKDEVIMLTDFVVTGTQIRGIDPVGTNLITFDSVAIQSTGAVSSTDLLTKIPQTGLFNTLPSIGADQGALVIRPSIRALPGSASSPTLLLLNGYRMVGSGTGGPADISVIPASLIERLDIMADGGSALYGSDAVGGVVNFQTRKKFDGTTIEGHYGVADDYFTTDLTLTSGFSWKGGSAAVALTSSKHDAIMGGDRDYYSTDHTARGGGDFRTPVDTITIGSNNYDLPTGTPIASKNKSDKAKWDNIYPEEVRQGVFVSGTHKLYESVDINFTGYYANHITRNYNAQPTFTSSIKNANPYFRPVGSETSQSFVMDLAPAFGQTRISDNKSKVFGISPEAVVKLGSDWQLRVPLNYGENQMKNYDRRNINSVALSNGLLGTTASTAFNPYNINSPTNSSILAATNDYLAYSTGNLRMADAQAIADGSVANLPGGKLKVAVGAEWYYEQVESRLAIGPKAAPTLDIPGKGSRTVTSGFTEIVIPIVGSQNQLPGVKSFKLDTSARTDHYSDLGTTTNPKYGFTYKPIQSLILRGNYGTSFNAPGLSDMNAAVDTRAQYRPSNPPVPPSIDRSSPQYTQILNTPFILWAGGNPSLKPQKAKTWSFGADWDVPVVKGLTMSATFYDIQFSNAISPIPFRNPIMFTDPSFSKYYVLQPTQQQLQDFIGNLPHDGFGSIASLYGNGNDPYIVIDARRSNLGLLYTSGLDLALSYTRPTQWGSIYGSLNGNRQLKRAQKVLTVAPWSDQLAKDTSKMSYRASAGTRIGAFDGSVALNYLDGYDLSGTGQKYLSPFYTVDLFFSYDIDKTGMNWFKGVSATLGVNNLLNREPSFNKNSSTGITAGTGGLPTVGTTGRLVTVGLRKKF